MSTRRAPGVPYDELTAHARFVDAVEEGLADSEPPRPAARAMSPSSRSPCGGRREPVASVRRRAELGRVKRRRLRLS